MSFDKLFVGLALHAESIAVIHNKRAVFHLTDKERLALELVKVRPSQSLALCGKCSYIIKCHRSCLGSFTVLGSHSGRHLHNARIAAAEWKHCCCQKN